ncbi:MAG: lysylphosphatidylglycerol synthase transmembrane domain-containing protein [Dehalococcoidia bacterium]
MNVSNLRQKLLISVVLGIIVFGALVVYGDIRSVRASLADFRWELMPLVLLIAAGNYVLRWVKWHYYLRRIGETSVPRLDSFLIFMSGLGMVVTPAKVGEWLKCYLLKDKYGTPVMRSTPILFAERLTDALALMLLALVGVVAFERSVWPLVAVVILGSAIVIAVSRHRPAWRRMVDLARRLPLVGRLSPRIDEMAESNYQLMDPWGVVLMTGLSVVAWGTQVVAFYLVLAGLGVDAGGDTFMKASFILPISTLGAGILLLPGGLGVAETGIASLTESLLETSRGVASTATLLIRVSTLWFAVVLGLVAFFVVMRREPVGEPEDEIAESRLVTASDPIA